MQAAPGIRSSSSSPNKRPQLSDGHNSHVGQTKPSGLARQAIVPGSGDDEDLRRREASSAAALAA